VVLSKDKKGVGMLGETNDDNKKEKEGHRAKDILRAHRRAVSF
jgi:hypothetical protein